MHTRRSLLLLTGSLALALPPTAAPAAALGAAPRAAVQQAGPVASPDGIPAGTSPAAAEIWRNLTRSMRSGSAVPQPLTSFDVKFELLDRAEPDGRPRPGSIETIARVRWLSEYYVSLRTEDKREIGYTGTQYYLLDGEQELYLNGREYQEDRARINSALSLAKNFASLADLSNISLQSLQIAAGPPPGALPRGPRYDRLGWLELRSPDFGVVEGISAATDRGPRMYRVLLGYLPLRVEDGQALPPLLQVMHVQREALDLTSGPAAASAAPPVPEQLILLDDLRDNGGFVVPHRLSIFSRVPSVPELANFKEKPDRDLWLMRESQLAAPLTPEQFGPQAKK